MPQLRERFSNPLLFSFASAWLFVNWRVVVALLWYDPGQVHREGFESVFAFIEVQLNINSTLWWPLGFAGGYVVLFPIIKNLIHAFSSWTQKWGEEWNLRILNGSQISIDKYLRLRSEYKDKLNKLEDVIEKESEYMFRLNKSEMRVTELQEKENELSMQLDNLLEFKKKLRDMDVLNGVWECTYEHDNTTSRETVVFQGHDLFVMTASGGREKKFQIHDFYYSGSHSLFFVKHLEPKFADIENRGRMRNNRLRFEGRDMMVGTENDNVKVSYQRK